jgi:hypothetical protein
MKQMRLALDLLFENFNLGFGYEEGLNTIVLVLCRDTLSLYTQFAGMCLGTFWHLLLRTLSKSGTWAWVVMESVFMNSIVMATTSMHVCFILIIHHYCSLAVIR